MAVKKTTSTARPAPLPAILQPRRLGVAISGGADSVSLAVRAVEARKAAGLWTCILNVNHGKACGEGPEAAAFVKSIAKMLDVPFYGCTVRVKRKRGESIEMAARRLRLDFFKRATSELKLDAIATGHTSDDAVETLIMRLARGSGAEGLAGLKSESHLPGLTMTRPLLDETHDMQKAFLESRSLEWREDPTNTDLSIMRNRVRHVVIPFLEKNLAPQIKKRILKTIAALRNTSRRFPSTIQEKKPAKTPTAAKPTKWKLSISSGKGWRKEQETFSKDVFTASLSPAFIAGRNLEIRFRKPGDYIIPVGLNHRKKVQDVFVERKIPQAERDSLPLLAEKDSPEILWVPGYRVSAKAALESQDGDAVILTLRKA